LNNKIITYLYGILTLVIPAAFVILALFICDSYSCITFEDESASIFSQISAYLPKIFLILVWFIATKIFIHFFVKIYLKKRVFNYETNSGYIIASKVTKLISYSIFTIISITILFKNIGAIITSLGLIGFGITFALQKPILNFVGWLNLIVNKPYSVGDRIKIGEVRGDVIDINIMNTVVEALLEISDTKSGKIATFPNELILTSPVYNYTKSSNYLIEDLKIGITYESDYKKAMELLKGIIKENTKKIIDLLKKRITKKEIELDEAIKELTKRFISMKKGNEKELEKKIEQLKQEKKELTTSAEDLPDEFVPRVRIDLSQSSIDLVAFFVTPFYRIRKTKTEIYLAFLDAIKNEKNIEIAYPHLEIRRGKI